MSTEDCGHLFNHGIQFELPIGCNAEPIPIVITDARSAEMMRYAAKRSFSDEIGNVGRDMGIDAYEEA